MTDRDENEMRVTKRNGAYEVVAFDKILNRVKKIGSDANISVNFTSLIMKVIDQLYDGIPTSKIDDLLLSNAHLSPLNILTMEH